MNPECTQQRQPMEVLPIMRALDPEVVDAVWEAVKALLPAPPPDCHPLRCHRPRVPDRVCFEGILIRLTTGCAWVDVEALMGRAVSDTTLRARRNEWLDHGVFDAVADEALAAYDRLIGFDFSECAVDGSLHKAPCGGEGTGRNPTDRGKLGWKWSLLTERSGVPVGWTIAGANRNDSLLLGSTLLHAKVRGLLGEVETLHLDLGYDSAGVRDLVAGLSIDDLVCAKRRKPGTPAAKKLTLGMRWPVERTNSWLSNFGQLRRNTDRTIPHRLAQLALAIVILITAKLIDWRDRWSR